MAQIPLGCFRATVARSRIKSIISKRPNNTNIQYPTVLGKRLCWFSTLRRISRVILCLHCGCGILSRGRSAKWGVYSSSQQRQIRFVHTHTASFPALCPLVDNVDDARKFLWIARKLAGNIRILAQAKYSQEEGKSAATHKGSSFRNVHCTIYLMSIIRARSPNNGKKGSTRLRGGHSLWSGASSSDELVTPPTVLCCYSRAVFKTAV